MHELVRPRPAAPAPPIPPDIGKEKALVWVRRLIWTYLVLLILEGALRKWIVPRFSDPLLIVRDPVVIAIYLFALRGGVFPRNRWVILAWHHRLSFVARQYLRFDAVSSAENYFLRHHLRSALQLSASAADFCYRECF